MSVALPFTGRWTVQNSPARRVPSHGTTLPATADAIDFVAVDAHDRTGPRATWRTVVATEPPHGFTGFGRPVQAPVGGRVVAVHDGEPDHGARRSALTLLPYALTQGRRLRRGVDALAGNRVLIAGDDGVVVALLHLRAGSVCVSVGDRVAAGQRLGECGNSGNSTQPHIHMQAMDGIDPWTARAVPMRFTRFREQPRGRRRGPVVREDAVPDEGSVVEPLPGG